MASAVSIQINAKSAANELNILSRAFVKFNREIAGFSTSIGLLKKIKGVGNISKIIGADQLARAGDALRILDQAVKVLTPSMQSMTGAAINVGQAQLRMSDAIKRAGVDVEQLTPVLNRAGDSVNRFNITVDRGQNLNKVLADLRKAMNEVGLSGVALGGKFLNLNQSLDTLSRSQLSARQSSDHLSKFLKTLGVDAQSVTVGMNNAGTSIKKVNLVLKGQGDVLGIQKAVTNELNRMGQSAHNVSVRFKEQKQASADLGNTLGGLKTKLLAIAATFLSGMGIKEVVSSIANARIQFQRIENTLFSATGTLTKARQEFGFVSKESERLGLDLGALAGQFARFTAAAQFGGLSAKTAQTAFLGVAEAATVLQLSSADTLGVIKALEQIISKGTVSAEELRGQLGDRLPGAFLIAAKSIRNTGESLDQAVVRLRKMLELGQLTSKEFVEKFGPAMREAFGGKALVAAQNSLFSNLTRLKNDALVTFGAIGGSAEEGFTDVIKAIRSILGPIKDSAETIGEAIGNIAHVVAMLTRSLKLLIAAFAVLTTSILSSFGAQITATVSALSKSSMAVGALTGALGSLKTALWALSNNPFVLAVTAIVSTLVLAKVAVENFDDAITKSMANITNESMITRDEIMLVNDAIESMDPTLISESMKRATEQIEESNADIEKLSAKLIKLREEAENMSKMDTIGILEIKENVTETEDRLLDYRNRVLALTVALERAKIAQKNISDNKDVKETLLEQARAAHENFVEFKRLADLAKNELSSSFGAAQAAIEQFQDSGLSSSEKQIKDWEKTLTDLGTAIPKFENDISDAEKALAVLIESSKKLGPDLEKNEKILDQVSEASSELAKLYEDQAEAQATYNKMLKETPAFMKKIEQERNKAIADLTKESQLIMDRVKATKQGKEALAAFEFQQKAINASNALREQLTKQNVDADKIEYEVLKLLVAMLEEYNAQNDKLNDSKLLSIETAEQEIRATNELADAMISGNTNLRKFQQETEIASKKADFLSQKLKELGKNGEDEAHRLADEYEKALRKLSGAEEFRRQVDDVSNYVSTELTNMFKELVTEGEINWERIGQSLMNIFFDAFQQILQDWIKKLIAMKAAEKAANLGGSTTGGGSSSGVSTNEGTLGSAAELAGGYGALAGYAAAIVGFAAILYTLYEAWDHSDIGDKSFGIVVDNTYELAEALGELQSSMGLAVDSFPDMLVRMRNDGKKFQVEVGNVFVGTFKTIEEAMEQGILETMRQIGNSLQYSVSDTVRSVLQNFDKIGIHTVDQLQQALEVAKQIDQTGMSDVGIAAQELQIRMSVLEQQAQALGISMEKVNAKRENSSFERDS